ncbi:alpha/beta hydrolase [Guyparkeria sp. 1SP6A2]|nr:alpha/beta hydrolase [Guyparkeria sp. 1SP6A2]
MSLLPLLTLAAMPARAEDTEAAWEAAWKEAEKREREEQRLLEKARNVNEGDLVFLDASPEPGAPPGLEKRIHLTAESLKTGWAGMEQCHYNLDPVPAVEVVYQGARTRAIEITRSEGVGTAVVEGDSIQMRDIRKGATLCVRAESKALEALPGDAGFLLENGPFMRRFLDGYYPMQVELVIEWPAGLLELVETGPAEQPGHAVAQNDHSVTIRAHFEGRLVSQVRLEGRSARIDGISARPPGRGSRGRPHSALPSRAGQ